MNLSFQLCSIKLRWSRKERRSRKYLNNPFYSNLDMIQCTETDRRLGQISFWQILLFDTFNSFQMKYMHEMYVSKNLKKNKEKKFLFIYGFYK